MKSISGGTYKRKIPREDLVGNLFQEVKEKDTPGGISGKSITGGIRERYPGRISVKSISGSILVGVTYLRRSQGNIFQEVYSYTVL